MPPTSSSRLVETSASIRFLRSTADCHSVPPPPSGDSAPKAPACAGKALGSLLLLLGKGSSIERARGETDCVNAVKVEGGCMGAGGLTKLAPKWDGKLAGRELWFESLRSFES
jgi:hypothetical protein